MRGHLVRRGGTYWFRRRVPEALAERLGRREIHRSLATSSPREAAERARRAWLVTQAVFEAMSRNLTLQQRQALLLVDQLLSEPPHASPTADQMLDDFLNGKNVLVGTLTADKHGLADLMEGRSAEEQALLRAHLERIADRAELAVARKGQDNARMRAGLNRIEADKASTALAEARREIAGFEVSRQVAERLGEIAGTVRPAATVPEPEPRPEPVAGQELSRPRGRSKSPRFSEVAAPFLADKKRGSEGYTGQTAKQVEATFRLWLDLVGDRPVREYTGSEAGNFRDLVLRLPASHGKGGRMHATEEIRAADRKDLLTGEKVPRLAMKTAKRHFSALSQLWEWMRPRDHVEKNIFRGFSFPGTKSNRKLREDWGDEDLLRVLGSKWFGHSVPPDSGQRWVPLIGMYSGLRLEEICRLRPAHDVEEIEGVPCFRIQEHPEPEPWSPKTEAGERILPVHPVLIELGLAELVERRRAEGARRLFPEFRPTGPDRKYGTEFSRKFGKLKQGLGVGEKTVFHSLRHSVRTILGNTDVKETWIDAVLGHENGEQSVGIAVYLKRIGVQNLRATVGAIAYPDEVTEAVRRVMAPLPDGGP